MIRKALCNSLLQSAFLERELGRHDLEPGERAASDELERDRAVDQLADHQPLEVAGVLDRNAVHRDDQILGAQTGARRRAAVGYLDDLDPCLRPTAAAIRGGSGRGPPAMPI